MAKEKKNGLLSFFGFTDNYDDEDDEEYDEEEFEEEEYETPVRRREAEREHIRKTRKASVVPLNNKSGVIVYSIRKYNEAQSLVKLLLQSKQVLVKFDKLEEKKEAQRVLDFMSGAAYACDAQVVELEKNSIYMFVSNGTTVDMPKRMETNIGNENYVINNEEEY